MAVWALISVLATSRWQVWGRALLAFSARQHLPQRALTALRSQSPGPVLPGGIMANMLTVPTRQLGHPIGLVILVKADDSPVHGAL